MHEEDKLWQMNGDQIDKITELNEEIIERDTKIVETEDQVLKAREEASEGKTAKNTAEEELRNMKREYERLHRKCIGLRKASRENDLEIKRKELELERLKAQKVKEAPKEERVKKAAARSILLINPPQSGPPQSGMMNPNPPQSGLPQSSPIDIDVEENLETGKEENVNKDLDIETEKDPGSDTGSAKVYSGWATNSGLTPCVTPKRERKPIGRTNSQPTDNQYTSGSDSEGTKRKRNGVFKIPRIPSKTPTPQKIKEQEKELFDKDKLIENLRRQLNE